VTPTAEEGDEAVPEARFVEVSPPEARVVLENLSAVDWDQVNSFVDLLPGMNRRVRVPCEECGAEQDTVVDPTSLFLVGS
jgi:hypothetical protein